MVVGRIPEHEDALLAGDDPPQEAIRVVGFFGQEPPPELGVAHGGYLLGERQAGDRLVARVQRERVEREIEPEERSSRAGDYLAADRQPFILGVLERREKHAPPVWL